MDDSLKCLVRWTNHLIIEFEDNKDNDDNSNSEKDLDFDETRIDSQRERRYTNFKYDLNM